MPSPRVAINYCTQCRWMLRAAWMAQELLTTFSDELGEVALVPDKDGVFEVRVGERLIWSRKRDGGFPDVKRLKQLVRDEIAPEKNLGHSDHAGRATSGEEVVTDRGDSECGRSATPRR